MWSSKKICELQPNSKWYPSPEVMNMMQNDAKSCANKDVVTWFLIKDVNQAQRVQYNKYLIKGLFCTMIGIAGNIREVSETKTGKGVLIVDDGTDFIRCMFDRFEKVKDKNKERMYEALQAAPETPQNVASLLFLKPGRKIHQQKLVHEFKVGDYVKLIGHIREYEKAPYMYVKEGRKADQLKTREDFLENLFKSYGRMQPDSAEKMKY